MPRDEKSASIARVSIGDGERVSDAARRWPRGVGAGVSLTFWASLATVAVDSVTRYAPPELDLAPHSHPYLLLRQAWGGYALLRSAGLLCAVPLFAGVWMATTPPPTSPSRMLLHRVILRGLALQHLLLAAALSALPFHGEDAATSRLLLAGDFVASGLRAGGLIYAARLFAEAGLRTTTMAAIAVGAGFVVVKVAVDFGPLSTSTGAAHWPARSRDLGALAQDAATLALAVATQVLLWRLRRVLAPRDGTSPAGSMRAR